MDKEKDTEQELSCEQRYLKRLACAKRFYLQLVIAVIAVCSIAIFISVMIDVLLGAALAIFAAAVYIYFSTDELYKQLGLRSSFICGRIHITRAVMKYGDTMVIPSRLMWADVTKITDGAFASEKNESLACIYLPRSIECIGDGIFGDRDTPISICYEGSEEEWSGITGADSLSVSSISFNCPQPTLPPKQKKKKGSDCGTEAGK